MIEAACDAVRDGERSKESARQGQGQQRIALGTLPCLRDVASGSAAPNRVDDGDHDEDFDCHDDRAVIQPLPVTVYLGRELIVVLHQPAKYQCENQWRTGPATLLHPVTQNPEGKTDPPVAHGIGRDPGAHEQHGDDARNDQVSRHERDLVDMTGEQHQQRRRHHVRHDDGPDHAEGQRQVDGEHVRPGAQPLDHQRAQQDRRADAAGNTERHGGNERPGLVGIVGRFRRDHATDIAAAKA